MSFGHPRGVVGASVGHPRGFDGQPVGVHGVSARGVHGQSLVGSFGSWVVGRTWGVRRAPVGIVSHEVAMENRQNEKVM